MRGSLSFEAPGLDEDVCQWTWPELKMCANRKYQLVSVLQTHKASICSRWPTEVVSAGKKKERGSRETLIG